jgi:saccharopine dehydrogenase (NAD+, L-lysine-forming)
MTFSDNYLTHLRVLENVGMTSIKPVMHEGREIIPLQFLKAVLPDPGSLGAKTVGRTCIGDLITGVKDGKVKHYFVWNECDHEECFRETGAQGVSYTTGVPAMIGAKMVLEGKWKKPGVWNMEQFDPDPFMADMNRYGLPWQEKEMAENPLAGIQA